MTSRVIYYPKDSSYRNSKVMEHIRERTTNTNSLPLVEVFSTLEGEGVHVGAPKVLLRVGGCPIGCHWCFLPETMINSPSFSNPVALASLKEGHFLWTLDPLGNKVRTKIVKVIYSNKTREKFLRMYYRLGEQTYVLTATVDHPFYIIRKGWIKLKDIKIGDELRGLDMRPTEDKLVYDDLDSAIYSLNIKENEDISSNPIVTEISPLSSLAWNELTARKEIHFRGKVGVINFKCEPYNNFLIGGILSHNCDSPHTFGIKTNPIVSIKDIVDGIVKNYPNFNRVSITGGEPMLYPKHMSKLITGLRSIHEDMYIEMETSGAILNSNLFKKLDFLSMDIKTPSSKVEFSKEHVQRLIKLVGIMNDNEVNMQFKAVVKDESDLTYIESHFQWLLGLKTVPLVITPCAETGHGKTVSLDIYSSVMDRIVTWTKFGYNVRIIPQIHKIFNFR